MHDPKKEIILEDDKMILVNDIKPGAEIHILAISKRHIKNINYLNKDDIPLLRHMEVTVKEFIHKNYGQEKLDQLK